MSAMSRAWYMFLALWSLAGLMINFAERDWFDAGVFALALGLLVFVLWPDPEPTRYPYQPAARGRRLHAKKGA